ncbi:hypothetical protein VP424E501_P0115 [Vibrio phage 424E50-1]|nr:hypothetical protein VP424E501_P0115 [Vibrio phage 424E50-1]
MTAKEAFLAGFTSEELALELEKRNHPVFVRPTNKLKVVCGATKAITDLAEEYVTLEETGEEGDHTYAYELVLKLTYGEEIFDYLNSLN